MLLPMNLIWIHLRKGIENNPNGVLLQQHALFMLLESAVHNLHEVIYLHFNGCIFIDERPKELYFLFSELPSQSIQLCLYLES